MSALVAAVDEVRAVVEARLRVPLHGEAVPFDGGEVRLWTAPLDSLADMAGELRDLLAPAEREQADGLRVPRVAHRFCAGRAALRAVLGAELQLEAAQLRLRSGAHGKPALDAAHDSPLAFNVAHSGGVVMIATTRDGTVGVDVERRREVAAVDRLSRRALAPSERDLFERWRGEGESPLDAFFRAWTVKEARLKALGLPIGVGLSRDHPEASRVPWRPVAVPLGDDYFGAVAFAPART